LGRPGREMAPTSPLSSIPMWGKEKNTYRSRPVPCGSRDSSSRRQIVRQSAAVCGVTQLCAQCLPAVGLYCCW
jgi:hypothetical protein